MSSRTLRVLLFSVLSLLILALAGAARMPTSARAPHPAPTGLPSGRFEPNVGQFPAPTRFAVRHGAATAFLGPTGVTLCGPGDRHEGVARPVQLEFLGARRGAEEVPGDRLAGWNNYFLGADPKRWHTHVPAYEGVRFREVYPGTDLAFYTRQGELEYDFVLAPRADPGRIRLRVRGSDDLRIGARGELVLAGAPRTVVQPPPVAYQDTPAGRRAVPASYALAEDRTVRIALGSYDPQRTLVIDPVLVFSTYLSAANVQSNSMDDSTFVNGVAADGAGSVYVAGTTTRTKFPTTPSVYDTTWNGEGDVFVTKFDNSGAVVYSTFIGGGNDECAAGIAVDAAGAAYITGDTGSLDFPVTRGAYVHTTSSAATFVVKLAPDGGSLGYSGLLADSDGPGPSSARAIVVDSTGSAYISGRTHSLSFPVTPGAYQTTNGAFAAGGANAFVSKLSPDGSSLVYSTYLGGTGSVDQPKSPIDNSFVGGHTAPGGLAVDAGGNAYVVGSAGTGFPTTPGAFHTAGNGGVFVTKLAPAGDALVYSSVFGDGDVPMGAAVDAAGRVYVCGRGGSDTLPVTNPTYGAGGAGWDAFLLRLSADGSSVDYSVLLGGAAYDDARAVVPDGAGGAYVAGTTDSSDFPVASPIQNALAGAYDTFVAHVGVGGTTLPFCTYLGGGAAVVTGSPGEARDIASAIALDPSGAIYVAGWTASSNFPVVNPWISQAFEYDNGFLYKLAALSVPGSPLSLTASISSGTTVHLTWTDGGGEATAYSVERTDANGAFFVLANPAATSYDDIGVPANTTLSYRVRAHNTAGYSGYSNVATVGTGGTGGSAPATPTGLTAAMTPDGTAIQLAWSQSDGDPTGFRIERATGTGPFGEITTVSGGARAYGDSSVVVDTRYTYRIRAYNGSGTSAYSNTSDALTPPAAPANLSLDQITTSEIRLSWIDRSATEDAFRIERQTTGAYALVAVVGAGVTSYTDTGLQPAVTYSYRVRAVNSGGASAYTDPAVALTLPAPPAGLAAVAAPGVITLSWTDPNPSPTIVYLERWSDAQHQFQSLQQLIAGSHSYLDTAVSAGKTYYYRARMGDATGTSAYSDTVWATVPPNPIPAPSPPTNLEASGVAASGVTLTWSGSDPNTLYYRLERQIDGAAFAPFTTVGPDVHTFIDTGLPANSQCCYRARAVGASGASDYSSTVCFLTLPLPPTNVAATAVPGSVSLTWTDPNPHSTDGQLERWALGDSGFQLLVQPGAGMHAYTDTTVAPGETYLYRLRYGNETGFSDYSNIAVVEVPKTVPAPPGGLAVGGVTVGTVSLTWTGADAATTAYRIERQAPGGSFQAVADVSSTLHSYTDAGLAADTAYSYRLQALGSGAGSAYSANVSALTLPLAPTGFTATPGRGSVALSWSDPNPTSTAVRLERGFGSAVQFTALVSLPAGTHSFTDSGVSTGATYYYRLRSTNASGNSTYSELVQAVPLPTTSGKLGAVPAKISFPVTAVGASVTRTLTISNTSTTDALSVTLASNSAEFEVTGGTSSFSIAPKGKQQVTLRFAPSQKGARAGTLTLTTSDSSAAQKQIALSGKGK